MTRMQVLSEVANTVWREAFVMAYSDSFFVIGIALALCILPLFVVVRLPPEVRPPLPSKAKTSAHSRTKLAFFKCE